MFSITLKVYNIQFSQLYICFTWNQIFNINNFDQIVDSLILLELVMLLHLFVDCSDIKSYQ